MPRRPSPSRDRATPDDTSVDPEPAGPAPRHRRDPSIAGASCPHCDDHVLPVPQNSRDVEKACRSCGGRFNWVAVAVGP